MLNAAMAGYVLDYYARMLTYVGDAKAASEAHAKAEAQRQAVRADWEGRWFRRAWLGPQPGLDRRRPALAGAATLGHHRRRGHARAAQDPGRGARRTGTQAFADRALMLRVTAIQRWRVQSESLTNGGIWPRINGTLIWALALQDGALAWDEWKKNSLAMHAEAYPDIWYGIWSGPDYLQFGAVQISRPDHVRGASGG